MPRHRALWCLVVAVQLVPWVAPAATVTDRDRGFTLVLPSGFRAVPDYRPTAQIPYAFVTGDLADDQLDVYLFIEQIDGPIGRERLKREQLPPGFAGRLFTTTWKGFQVDAFEVPEELNGVPVITYNVQIPLKRKAIQLKLMGLASRRDELDGQLKTLLAGLDGETNWGVSSPLGSPGANASLYGVLLLCGALVIVVGGLVALWMTSRATPRGTVLLIGLLLYLSSWMLKGIRIREVLVFAGALRMLGFAGLILGLVDFMRRRTAPPGTQ